MTRSQTLSTLLMTLVLAASCGKEEVAPMDTETKAAEPTTAEPGPATAVAPEATKPVPATTEFASDEHKFTVMSKQAPRITKPASPPGAGPITSYMFSSPGVPGAYMVLVATVPLPADASDADRKKALTDGRDGLVTKYSATISSDKEIDIGGNPGRDFSFSASHPQMGEMVGRSKIVTRGSELYQVMRVGKPDAKDLIAEADAFIDSFTFKAD